MKTVKIFSITIANNAARIVEVHVLISVIDNFSYIMQKNKTGRRHHQMSKAPSWYTIIPRNKSGQELLSQREYKVEPSKFTSTEWDVTTSVNTTNFSYTRKKRRSRFEIKAAVKTQGWCDCQSRMKPFPRGKHVRKTFGGKPRR